MVENVWGLVAVLVFYLIILIIGIVAGRKQLTRDAKSNTTETMLAGRSIGMVVGLFTMTATWVGGGFINGTAEAIYLAVEGKGGGLVWVQAPIGYSISLIIGGLFFAKPMREAGYMTMIDPFQKKLGDWMGALLVLPALSGEIFWSAAILGALGSTLSVIIGLEMWISVIISACVALLYVVIGGLASVVYTDVIQLCCIAVGLVVAVPFALKNEAVGDVFLPAGNCTKVDWLGYVDNKSWGIIIDGYLHLMCGGIPWQVYFQRVLASKTPRGAQILSILGGIGCLIMALPPIMLGAIGYATDWNTTTYQGVDDNGRVDPRFVLPLVLQYLTPPVVAVIGLGAVSAAVMSSADSSMLSSSTMFAQNVYKPVFRPKATARELIWVMRGAAVVFCAIAAILALTIESTYGLLVLCGDFVYVLLFPQLVCVMFVPWFNVIGSLTGFIVSLILRLLGGEALLGWRAVIGYPGYDPVTNTQYFPFKTMSMLVGLGLMLSVSYATHWATMKGYLRVNLKPGTPVPTDEIEEDGLDSEKDEVSLQLMRSNEIVDADHSRDKFT